jgi:hypothetical protein
LTSRSCFVPMNHAMTLSMSLAASMRFRYFRSEPTAPDARMSGPTPQRKHFILSV